MSWNFLATVRLRQRVTKGPGSRAAGVAMAFKLIESAQTRWRAVNAPHLVALVRAGAVFKNGKLIERPDGSIVMLLPLAVIATSIAALVRIVQRAGYSGWWILIVLVPGANLLALWYFGFGPWPALPERGSPN